MSRALVAVDLTLALLLLATAMRKRSHAPDVVASYARVGVPEHRLDLLAGLLVVGAIGLLAGHAVPPVGLAAAGCLVAYFSLAVIAHLRHEDLAHLGPPVVLLLLSATALVLRASTP